jgi:hypothetical protein
LPDAAILTGASDQNSLSGDTFTKMFEAKLVRLSGIGHNPV